METKNFEQQVAEMQNAQEHAQEIRQTRVGGLGGSDAAILMKIGERGLSALTQTDNKRLAIMLGMAEQNDWGGNAYTNAGHMFEDYAERVLPLNSNYKREEFIERKLARNFKTFAHADFTERNDDLGLERLTVVECKFVQGTTTNTISKYYAQLQWYYLLGADAVVLYHGTGTADPFEVFECEAVQVERDEVAIKILLNGIKILDEALADGWKPENVEKIQIENTPEKVQDAFERWRAIQSDKKELETKENEVKAIIKEYLEDFSFTGIVANGDMKHQVIYKRGGTNLSFDGAKFLADHPEFDLPEYYKKTNIKSSVTFK